MAKFRCEKNDHLITDARDGVCPIDGSPLRQVSGRERRVRKGRKVSSRKGLPLIERMIRATGRCPRCGKWIKSGYDTCHHCGTRF